MSTKGAQLASMKVWLADAEPLVAYLDPTDAAHRAVGTAIDGVSGALASTGAVLTEAMHLLSSTPGGPRLLTELVLASRMTVYDLCQPPETRRALDLVERDHDTPMDFADATLVLLSEALGAAEILTLDRRGFSAYRTRPGRAFRLVLDVL